MDFDHFWIKDKTGVIGLGVEHIWKVRVETEPDGGATYSIKVWPASENEPVRWGMTANGPADVPCCSLLQVAIL